MTHIWVNLKIPDIPGNTRKYPKYPEIPERKKDTRKYRIVFFDTPTPPEPDPLPGILSNTRPDPPDIEKPYPLGTGHCQAKTTFTFHFSILILPNAFLSINNKDMKSESGLSLAMASQHFTRVPCKSVIPQPCRSHHQRSI